MATKTKSKSNASPRGPIHAATRTISGVTKYITSPVMKGVDYLDRGLGKALKGKNPAMRFTGKDGEKAAKSYARLLQGEGKKARAEKSWGDGWQVVTENPTGLGKKYDIFYEGEPVETLYASSGPKAIMEVKRLDPEYRGKKLIAVLRKGNPESEASSMYESFHGRASEEIAEYVEQEHYHGHLAELGQLIELKVRTVTGLDATFNFDYQGKPEKGVILASNESGTSLYFVGGDQSLCLKSIKMNTEEWEKDSMVIGDAYFVSYYTEKDFDKFEPIIYEHQLGEETGDLPVLRYDKLNERIYLDGGAYIIKTPWGETSAGIEN